MPVADAVFRKSRHGPQRGFVIERLSQDSATFGKKSQSPRPNGPADRTERDVTPQAAANSSSDERWSVDASAQTTPLRLRQIQGGRRAACDGHYRLKPFISNCRASKLPKHVTRAILDGPQLAE